MINKRTTYSLAFFLLITVVIILGANIFEKPSTPYTDMRNTTGFFSPLPNPRQATASSFKEILPGQPFPFRFRHIGEEAGLLQKKILSIIRDRQGYLWLGTNEGLVRYDGYEFHTFTYKFNDSTTLSNNQVLCLFEDSRGWLWIGTDDGLNCFIPGSESFFRFRTLPDSLGTATPNVVYSICEDSSGAIWTGNNVGLSRIRFLLGPATEQELSPDWLRKHPDLIGIDHLLPESNNSGDLRNRMFLVLIDHVGNFWIGTELGLARLLPESPMGDSIAGSSSGSFSFELLYKHSSYTHSLLETPILRLLEDHDGFVWAKTMWGLIRIEPPQMPGQPITGGLKYENYPFNDSRLPYFQQGAFLELPGKNGSTLWMNLKDAGFAVFDPHNRTYSIFTEGEPGKVNTSIPFFIHTLYLDRSGILWIGTDPGGLFKYDIYSNRFSDYNQKLDKIIKNDQIDMRFVFEDSRGVLWIANEGVYRCDRRSGEILSAFWTDRSSPEWTFKNAIQEDRRGYVWIASEYGGLYRYDSNRKQMTRLVRFTQNLSDSFQNTPQITGRKIDQRWLSLSPITTGAGDSVLVRDNVAALARDQRGFIWAAATIDIYGKSEVIQKQLHMLYKIDPLSRKIHRYPLKMLSGNNKKDVDFTVYAVKPDTSGILWLGTDIGFVRFEPATGAIVLYQSDPRNSNSLSSNRIHSIKTDMLQPKRYIWLGTNEGGLNRFDRQTETFRHYTTLDGLPDNTVSSILDDRQGNLWLGTNRGLCNVILDPETREVLRYRNYDRGDGINDDDFSFFYGQNAYKNAKGEMFFAGAKGISIFNPDDIKDDPHPPAVIITGFYLNFRLVSFRDPGSPLTAPVSQTKKIVLPYQDNTFSLKLAALDFHSPGKNRFAYQLEGFQDEWIYPGKDRQAVYTQVPPGEYIFHAIAANRDGVWNEEGVSLQIIISPPWYRTWWAYILYALTIIASLWAIRRSELNRHKLKMQTEIQQVETKRLKEVDRLKTHFFTNVSHEFRTPLTLIMGPVEQELEESKVSGTRRRMKMVQRNAKRLTHLINQLLDLSALEANRMELRAAPGDIVAFVRGISMGFSSWAEEKQISLKVFTKAERVKVYFDRDLMEKVFNNLLSNALKFTQRGGSIEVSITPPQPSQIKGGPRRVEISVHDSGIGIHPERLPHIFDRFYQGDASTTREFEGSGIGLALVKELVELHGGHIRTESKEGQGTTFTIALPLGKDHLKPEQIIAAVTVSQPVTPLQVHQDEYSTGNESGEGKDDVEVDETIPEPSHQLPLLLIVEDHADFRSYLREYLDQEYRLMEARDGQSGWEKALETTPDLVISDVMMPRMDGFELCEKLKTDERTSHIPIILLTAKAAQEDKLEGLGLGADDYLAKPFDSRELRIRVHNLIEQRRKLQEYYRQQIVLKASGVSITSVDEKFLRKAIDVVEAHIGEEQFSVDELSSGVAMSRSQFHRKIQALTGKSSTHFIRTIRLQRAAELIQKGAGNVTEVAFMVGFNSHSYFTKCFAEQFGCSPSEYKQ